MQRGDQLGSRADLDAIKNKPQAKELYLHHCTSILSKMFEFHRIMRVGDSEQGVKLGRENLQDRQTNLATLDNVNSRHHYCYNFRSLQVSV